MGTAELGIVIVMVVVRAPPNAAGAEGEDSKDSHQSLGETGVGQDRLMLLVMINHEEPENKQSGEKAANALDRKVGAPQSPRKGQHQEQRSRKDVTPTSGGGIHREWFRS